jgi:DNA-binding response OmpR family regulator
MPESSEQRRTILVVAVPGRIERVTRALIRTMKHVSAVEQVASGDEAIAGLEAGCADLVIWDSAALDGSWSALAEAKSRWPQVAAVALTGRAADEAAALAAGADAVLRRHYHVDSLLASIASLLARQG